MKQRRMFFLLCLLSALFLAAARGEDVALPAPESVAGPDFKDAFDFALAVRPRPGDWMEYHIAFPADPLESRLRPENGIAARPSGRAPETVGGGGVDYDALARLEPVFDPPETWVTVPVRIQIREVFEDGCNAEVTFAGETRAVRLGAAREARAEFRYDAGGEAEKALRIGGREYAVSEVRREGSDYGFVRWFSTEIPFGTVRFATEHVDMQIVGFGRGAPPEFPIHPEEEIAPPLGSLR